MKISRSIAVLSCFVLTLFAIERSYSDSGESQPAAKAQTKVLNGTLLVALQDDKSPTKKRTFKGRLPNNYGKIGLSSEQRNEIYGVQAKYRTQLEELQKQIAALKAKQDMEVRAVLNNSQKDALDKLLEAAQKKRDSRTKKKTATKSTPTKKSD